VVLKRNLATGSGASIQTSIVPFITGRRVQVSCEKGPASPQVLNYSLCSAVVAPAAFSPMSVANGMTARVGSSFASLTHTRVSTATAAICLTMSRFALRKPHIRGYRLDLRCSLLSALSTNNKGPIRISKRSASTSHTGVDLA
jgi:hypothetical protein